MFSFPLIVSHISVNVGLSRWLVTQQLLIRLLANLDILFEIGGLLPFSALVKLSLGIFLSSVDFLVKFNLTL